MTFPLTTLAIQLEQAPLVQEYGGSCFSAMSTSNTVLPLGTVVWMVLTSKVTVKAAPATPAEEFDGISLLDVNRSE